MRYSRRALLASGLSVPFLGLAGAGRALAAGTGSADELPAVFTRDGLAVSGYDPVAYFTEGRARPGLDSYRLRWHGAVWSFASEENRSTFEGNPAAYAPQFGGYCAYTVANGRPMKAEPDVWTIHEGRLYLNFNDSIRILWRRDMARNIAAARVQWRGFDKS